MVYDQQSQMYLLLLSVLRDVLYICECAMHAYDILLFNVFSVYRGVWVCVCAHAHVSVCRRFLFNVTVKYFKQIIF